MTFVPTRHRWWGGYECWWLSGPHCCRVFLAKTDRWACLETEGSQWVAFTFFFFFFFSFFGGEGLKGAGGQAYPCGRFIQKHASIHYNVPFTLSFTLLLHQRNAKRSAFLLRFGFALSWYNPCCENILVSWSEWVCMQWLEEQWRQTLEYLCFPCLPCCWTRP